MIKRKIIRKNNLYIPKSHSVYTYNRFIKQFIDQYNWGLLTKDGIKRFAFTLRYINECWAMRHPSYTDRIKLKLHRHIVPHLIESETYFYTSNPYSDVAMFAIDLDANESSTSNDMIQAAKYIINNFHKDAYYETSTSGRGIHIYIFVDVAGYDLAHEDIDIINDYLNKDGGEDNYVSYSSLLSQIVKLEGLNCKVDKIKGTFPRYALSPKRGIHKSGFLRISVGSYMIVKRGNLCKLPRPKNEDDFFKLVHTPIQLLTDIRRNSDLIKNLLKEKCGLNLSTTFLPSSTNTIISPNIPSNISPNIPPNIPHTPPSNILYMNHEKQAKKATVNKLRSRDAVKRTVGSIQFLARYLKRLPDYDEWHKFYVDNGLNTGVETPQRKERFENCLEFVSSTFDPEKCGPLYEVGDYLDDIKKGITAQELQEFCTETTTKITHADLDVAMGYHWVCTVSNRKKGWELTVPSDGMISWFRKLKKLGLYNRSCDRTKLLLLRQVLQKIGYITCIDDFWAKGTSKKWSVGENCPKYQDFITLGFSNDVKSIRKQVAKRRLEISENSIKND